MSVGNIFGFSHQDLAFPVTVFLVASLDPGPDSEGGGTLRKAGPGKLGLSWTNDALSLEDGCAGDPVGWRWTGAQLLSWS